ncbi:MAG TPA: ATP-binding protein [Labilithrix sp.]|jgi:signal transduction histidine kinase
MARTAGRHVDLADFLRREATLILRRWEQRVRSSGGATRDVSREVLLDHLPQFLERIAANSRRRGAVASSPPERVSVRHATERLEQGYGLADVVMEYVELRACIFERLEELGVTIDAKQSRQLHRDLDHALRETVRHYVASHEKMLHALDRLAGRRTPRRTLDEALADILSAVRETIGASIDTVTILLLEDGRLHVRASVGLEEDERSSGSVAIGEGFAGHVAESGRPMFVRDAASEPGIAQGAVRLRALYGVPLVEGDRVIGVAHIGSRTAYDISEEDRVLFRAMCERATTAIVRAQFVESLERTSRFREQFIGILGHDLRTPLNTILGTASLIVKNEDLPPHLAPAIQRVERSANRMARLISQLLDFTRARLGGGFTLHPSLISLLDVAREVADEHAPLLARRRLDVSGADVQGVWDRDRLAQALANLVGNAIQHSPDGSRIRVSVLSLGRDAAVEVWNEGPPIPDGTKLFEPFERATEGGGGLGLGLYIAHEIVRAHEGSLTVRSDGGGTTFTMTLPMTAVERTKQSA